MIDIEQILRDFSEQKITRVEAKQLIKTVMRRKPRKIRVRVRGDDGKNVNIVVPVSMIGKAISWVSREAGGVDFRSKVETAVEDEDFRGNVVEVESDDGDMVFVSIE